MDTFEFTRWGLASLVTIFTIGFGAIVLWLAMAITKDARKLKEDVGLINELAFDKLVKLLCNEIDYRIHPDLKQYMLLHFIAGSSKTHEFNRVFSHSSVCATFAPGQHRTFDLFMSRWKEFSAYELKEMVRNNHFLGACGALENSYKGVQMELVEDALKYVTGTPHSFGESMMAFDAARKFPDMSAYSSKALCMAIKFANNNERTRLLEQHMRSTREILVWADFIYSEDDIRRLGKIIASELAESAISLMARQRLAVLEPSLETSVASV